MKIFYYALLFVLLLFNSAAQAAEEPRITADAAILVEASTGRIIWEKNADVQRPPASMTKMLTCVLALEKLNPLGEVKVSREAAFTEDVALNWGIGDSVSAQEMVNAVMLISENGGAVALAEAVSGSVAKFSDLMNEKATAVGCKNSHFVNPNGLPNPNHYSTAADMARIAVYCMKNSAFRKVAEMQRATLRWTVPSDKRAELVNTNELLGKYNGANGIKTGWTVAAGGCLAASAKRGEVELIAIVMHSTDGKTRFDDAATLLNYGFERVRMVGGINREFTEKIVFLRGGKQGTVRVIAEENLNFPLLAGENSKLFQVTYDLPKVMEVGEGIHEGDVLGEAVLRYDGKPVARLPLVAREDVEKGFSLGSLLVSIAAVFL